MEQLLVQADNLHREAALLSNTLHQYADDDLDSVRPVVNKILSIRDQWKKIRSKIEYFEKTGRLPDQLTPNPLVLANTIKDNGGISELRLEIQRISTNISKHKAKLELTPNHKKAEQWREDLAKMEAMKSEIRTKIIEIQYAAT